ncbi:MAG: ATP-binding protein, partial [Pirellulaceae bacterium]|nr:ATP-binding protein [Pirellulaceae bacterium]
MHTQETTVVREGGDIRFFDLKRHERVGDLVREITNATSEGIRAFTLHFPRQTVCYPNVSAPLASIVHHYRQLGITIAIATDSTFSGITNIDSPRLAVVDEIDSSDRVFSGVWKFSDITGIFRLISKIIQVISERVLCSPGVLLSLEWCLNEVTDNVFRHSQNQVGFLSVQLHPNVPGQNLSICVADSGIGIFRSLRKTHFPADSIEAIQLSLEKGVTGDVRGQGNGLWGLSQLVEANSGLLRIISSDGTVEINSTLEETVVLTSKRRPYPGPKNQ